MISRDSTKLLIFLGLGMILGLLIVLFLPINLFTYRAWETLTPRQLTFPGPFYPYQHLSIVSIGDLGKNTPYSTPKQVEFITDGYGYRFELSHSEIVIVGDSFTVGSGLTQNDTLAAVLTSATGKVSYPYAPATAVEFLGQRRYQENPPQVVVLQITERSLLPGYLCNVDGLDEIPDQTEYFLDRNNQQNRVLIDRALRYPEYFAKFMESRYLKSDPLDPIMSEVNGIMFFFPPGLQMHSLETVPDIVNDLSQCHDIFAERGIEFIFLPVPDKENIYCERIPSADIITPCDERSLFLETLIAEADEAGIKTVDTLSVMQEAKADTLLYQPDDTHWNAEGVQVVVNALAPIVESLFQGND